MNSKKCSLIRPIGQRSITSTPLFRDSNRSNYCEKNVEIKASGQKGPNHSLSDFLNRKLNRSSVLPSSVQGKKLPFSSPLNGGDLNKDAEGGGKKGGEAVANLSIDGVFGMFKKVEKNKTDCTNCCAFNETETFDEDTLQQRKKRKSLFEGRDDKPDTGKRLAVLGEDSKPILRTRRKSFASEESRPLFNHYENGGGWWDDNMAGVDNEEVGCADAWEGVGCTTLGGIEWH
ncbi:hypothetical protein BUALT_Bualt12G0100600 [Buddleja alternifolia]|uniref:Uncharacterized protein n=1 Tax=Buddleja alternifolia TaxID=168488 RepID=A0AAV6WQL1_9LAMI|nr:hypothetical protein BUALT_Bualt12G0100600 [Buddleja alternifolia]